MRESEYPNPCIDDAPVTRTKKADGSAKFERLANKYIEHLCGEGRYPLYHGGRFFVYVGTHYVEDKELCFSVREFFKRQGIPQSNNVIGNVVPIVQSYAYKPTMKFPTLPFYYGSDPWPDAKNIIAYRNGLLDLSKYLLSGDDNLIPHTPKWHSTFSLPFEYDPQADCPLWLQFLDDVFEGDEGRIDLLQEWFGYCLTSDTSLQKAVMQVGKKRSGKGTTQFVLQQLLGAENWTAYNVGSLANNFGLCSLAKPVAFVGEVELSGHPQRTVIMERLKGIVGEDVQEIEIKYDPVKRSGRLPVRFMLACNDIPTFHDASGAIGSRFLFLHHQRSFYGREDTDLKTKLAAELPGVNNWALQGLVRLRANRGKFTTPETTHQLHAAFNRRSAPVECFVAERLAVQTQYDPGDLPGATLVDKPLQIESNACYRLYCEWCEEHGQQAQAANYFSCDLYNVLPRLPKDRTIRKDGRKIRVFHGIGDRPEPEATKDGTEPAPPSSPPAVAPGAAPIP